jgi:RHS repeat-associated protein
MLYDEIGNVARKNQSDINTAVAGGTAQTMTATTHNNVYTYAGPRPHAATNIGPTTTTGQQLDYDADGNQLFSRGTFGERRELGWNEEDRLKTSTHNGVNANYLYDGNGERRIKRTNGTTFYVNSQFMQRQGVQNIRHIMLGGERIKTSVIPSNGPATHFFYHTDHLQSANYMTDATGVLLQHNEYLPFGETWVEELRSTSNRTPFLFSGKEQEETKLYHMGARYYDPQTARWSSGDPAVRSFGSGAPNGGAFMPGNLGLYSYAYNNPIVLRDPSGLTPTKDGQTATVSQGGALVEFEDDPVHGRPLMSRADLPEPRAAPEPPRVLSPGEVQASLGGMTPSHPSPHHQRPESSMPAPVSFAPMDTEPALTAFRVHEYRIAVAEAARREWERPTISQGTGIVRPPPHNNKFLPDTEEGRALAYWKSLEKWTAMNGKGRAEANKHFEEFKPMYEMQWRAPTYTQRNRTMVRGAGR